MKYRYLCFSISTFCYLISPLYNIHSITLVTLQITWSTRAKTEYSIFTCDDFLQHWLTDELLSGKTFCLCEAEQFSDVMLSEATLFYYLTSLITFTLNPWSTSSWWNLNTFTAVTLWMQDIFINNICVWWYFNCFILSFSLRRGCLPPFLLPPHLHSHSVFFLLLLTL